MTQWHENLISVEEAKSLDGLFAKRIHRSPNGVAYKHFDREKKAWIAYTWAEMGEQIARWQAALLAENLSLGDRVAVQLRNCPEWVMFEQAALSLGLVVVPMYTDDRPDNIEYILRETDTRLLLIQDDGRCNRLMEVLPTEDSPLRRILLLDSSEQARALTQADSRIKIVQDWLPATASELQVRTDVQPDDLASIVYTSGTTGRSKGVMLSHNNLLWNAHACVALLDVYEQDVFLSFLPLSHTFERTCGYYVPIMAGASVVFSRSIPQLGEDLMAINPTVLIAVPRIYERVFGRIRDGLQKKSAFARTLFKLAVKIGWQRFLREQGRAGWSPTQLLWPLLRRLVADKILVKLGNRMRATISGGAALSPEIARVFNGLGLPLIQGYGLTETSPVITANLLENNIPASVGVPLRGLEVKIGEQDELLVRGPSVMLGYWNNHAATAKMIDSDRWLHTGDQARIGETGHVYITGRIKDILVLSNGEKVPPADMEIAIALDAFIDQVMVVGEGKPYLAALVVVNQDAWWEWSKANHVDPADDKALAMAQAQQEVLRRIKAALRDFPGYAKVRRVVLLRDAWTIDDGLLTPTLKVKRPKVTEKFSAEIAALYSDGLAS